MKVIRFSALSICHLVFLSVVALYLRVFYPASETLVMTIYFTGVLIELLPRWLSRSGFADVILVAVAGGCWWKLVPPVGGELLHGLFGMTLANAVLVPSRAGTLKWLLGLVILELLAVGRMPDSGINFLWSLPIGLAALAADRWLLEASGAEERVAFNLRRLFSMSRWALLPAIAVGLLAMFLGGIVVEEKAWGNARARWLASQAEQTDAVGPGFREYMAIGDHESIERDPRLVARLSWEGRPPATETVYLRGLVLPSLVLQGSTVSWRPIYTSAMNRFVPPEREFQFHCQLERMPSNSDVVLLPDGDAVADLDGQEQDLEGNLFRPQLGKEGRTYRIGFDETGREADPDTLDIYREVNPRLRDLPWEQIEQPAWRNMPPEDAAAAVVKLLNQRCTYAIDNLPRPAPGVAGALRTFLFAPNATDRRGHCQYYSTAAVLLMRRAGHTARCVSGFASNEIDARGVWFRSLHAHAWMEVVDSRGRWLRVDPTPVIHNARKTSGIDLVRDAPRDPARPDAALAGTPHRRGEAIIQGAKNLAGWWPIGGLVLGCGLVLKGLGVLRLGSFKGETRRLKQLQKRNEDLVQFAASLGVPITPATTLTVIVAGLEKRTGIELQTHLQAHLRARFGSGPLPEPWPFAELRRASRRASG